MGQKLTVIAWLWARTVKSPNPAFAQVDVPLASTFMLSTKAGKEAYVEPVIEDGGYRFTVKVGKPKDAEAAKNGTKLARGANFRCLMSGAPIAGDYIKAEGKAGRMGARLMAIVAEGERGRVYLAPTPEMEAVALQGEADVEAGRRVCPRTRAASRRRNYGLTTLGDLFTPRQLVALTTFSDLVQEARERVQRDALAAGLPDDGKPLARRRHRRHRLRRCGGGVSGVCASSKHADYGQQLCARGRPMRQSSRSTFGRQAIPMTWDFAEGNPFSRRRRRLRDSACDWVAKCCRDVCQRCMPGMRIQADACDADHRAADKVVSTDPPYYDNIGYADLSDFFYVWLRRSLQARLPRPLRHARRAQGRGAGRHALPPRQQGEGGGVLPRRHDAGDAPPRRAGASGLPGHHLLRLQAVRERRRRRHRQHRLGDLP